MFRLLSSLLLVALASGLDQPSFNPSSRVVNGEDAEPYSWPWQVSLQYEYSGGWFHTCGGTLISADWVITAAHCYSSDRTYRVVLGEYDRSVTEGPEQEILINPEDFIVHPLYFSICTPCGNDIALIKLSHSANLTSEVKPACLPPAGDILDHGTECYITGWGRLSTDGLSPNKLQKGLLPVVDHAHCTRLTWWGLLVRRTMVCAGGYEVSGCYGDSGGPLNCPAGDGFWQVHGVTSFVSSSGCNTERKPTVFTRVSAFIDWIEKTL
ncbi:chymotrypsin-like elastase family member 3B [Ochotona curzoniae]|uniref:chymotrypsin-like elastase family member 3B n=1 Tax=Ochotona curzoniae TaxID=130825 RepID=UPI001B350AB2|nr:chymotrypsin-like elastase family member 3B [Ochotona curzoniae]